MIYEMIKRYTCLDDSHLHNAINLAPFAYKKYDIPKKKGGTRQIFHPSKETKLLQYAIIDTFLYKLPVHDSATAYRYKFKRPLFSNAIVHAPYKYSLHLDFLNFFPSIKPSDLFNVLIANNIELSPEDHLVLSKTLFITHKDKTFLSIGAPASPIISNIVMYDLDQIINKIAKNEFNGVYTRYADDIWFSTDFKSGSNLFLTFVQDHINNISSPKLSLNLKKTHFCSKKKNRTVTGLTLTPNGDVLIPRIKKRHIRSLLNKKRCGAISENENSYLKGYLSFINDIEPDYLNSLIIKYNDVFQK